jgi:hypothetical protein
MELYESNRKNKRFIAIIDGKKYHFGSRGSSTYIDHKDKKKRENYIKRHSIREDWDEVNPGSLSRFLLWGNSTSLEKNIKDYIKRFNLKVQ